MRLANALLVPALFLSTISAQAAFTAISSPDAGYVGSTTLLSFSALPNFTNFSSVTDGIVTLTSSNVLSKRTVPGGWATWSAPPNAEVANPAVAFNSTDSVTLSLSQGVTIFGLEAEPNTFGTFTFTADYYNGATLLGTITRSADGNSGARLLAASDTAINRVVVSAAGSGGFAMAQFRYAVSAVPEPASVALLLGSIVLISRKLFRGEQSA